MEKEKVYIEKERKKEGKKEGRKGGKPSSSSSKMAGVKSLGASLSFPSTKVLISTTVSSFQRRGPR